METLLKHRPANVWLQGPLECLHNIYVRRPFTADDVEKIEITPKIDIINQSRHRPMLITQSQYSIPHCFAAYLETRSLPPSGSPRTAAARILPSWLWTPKFWTLDRVLWPAPSRRPLPPLR